MTTTMQGNFTLALDTPTTARVSTKLIASTAGFRHVIDQPLPSQRLLSEESRNLGSGGQNENRLLPQSQG
jgi:hypothetical protein